MIPWILATVCATISPLLLAAGVKIGYNRAVREADRVIDKRMSEHAAARAHVRRNMPTTNPGPQWTVKTVTEEWAFRLGKLSCCEYTALVVKLQRKGSKTIIVGDVDAANADVEAKVRALVVQANERCAFLNAQEVE